MSVASRLRRLRAMALSAVSERRTDGVRRRAPRDRAAASVAPLAGVYPGIEQHRLYAGDVLRTPEATSLRFHRDWDRVDRSEIRTPDAWVAELDDALVDARRGLVLGRDGSTIVEESVGYPGFDELEPWPPDAASLGNEQVEVDGVAVTFRCFVLFGNHYHAIVDGLPRLFGLATAARYRDTAIEVLVPGGPTEAEAHFLHHALPENFNVRAVPEAVTLRVERLLLPNFVTLPDVGVLPRRYLDWYLPKVVPDRPSKRCEKIYVSRRDVGVRRVQNEQEVIDALLTRGFVERDLAELTMDEQIKLFYDAETVVAPHGAGLANLLYGTGAGVVELFNSPYVRPHYYYLSKTVGHRWRHVVSDRVTKNEDFAVDVRQILRHVDELAS